jgi:hypothetical protein
MPILNGDYAGALKLLTTIGKMPWSDHLLVGRLAWLLLALGTLICVARAMPKGVYEIMASNFKIMRYLQMKCFRISLMEKIETIDYDMWKENMLYDSK